MDATDIAELLLDGMHLVGHSYGGVVSLLAATKRPEAVHSLTVIEPPLLEWPGTTPMCARSMPVLASIRERGPRDPEAFLSGFLKLAGSTAPLPTPLPPPLLQNAKLLMAERDPGEAVIPLDELRRAPFPKLVVSGAHSLFFDKICDALEKNLDAERAVIPGAGHSVQRTGAPFNERFEAFLRAAEAARSAD